MILADTSVWIDHFRTGNARLAAALEAGDVCMHPFILGELACGNLRNRRQVLELLRHLPSASAATDAEVLTFIEAQMLMGRDLGYVDVHLLAATALTPSTRLWTRDKRLAVIAARLKLGLT